MFMFNEECHVINCSVGMGFLRTIMSEQYLINNPVTFTFTLPKSRPWLDLSAQFQTLLNSSMVPKFMTHPRFRRLPDLPLSKLQDPFPIVMILFDSASCATRASTLFHCLLYSINMWYYLVLCQSFLYTLSVLSYYMYMNKSIFSPTAALLLWYYTRTDYLWKGKRQNIDHTLFHLWFEYKEEMIRHVYLYVALLLYA